MLARRYSKSPALRPASRALAMRTDKVARLHAARRSNDHRARIQRPVVRGIRRRSHIGDRRVCRILSKQHGDHYKENGT